MRLLARTAATVVLLLFIPVTASAAATSDVEPAAAIADKGPGTNNVADVKWTAEGILDALGSALGVKAGAKISASGHPQIVVGTRVMGAGG